MKKMKRAEIRTQETAVVAQETVDTQVKQVTSKPQPQPGEIVVTKADVESMIAAIKTKTQEAETVRQIGDTPIDIEVPTSLRELIRIRDNNRLTYTENLARFKNCAAQLAGLKPKLDASPEDENLQAGVLELQAALKKYLERMRRYLKRYMVCRDRINEIRAKEKAAAEAAKAEVLRETLTPTQEPGVVVVEE